MGCNFWSKIIKYKALVLHALSGSLRTWCLVFTLSPGSLPSLPSSPLLSSPFPLLLLFALVLDLLVLLPSYFSDSLSLFTSVSLSPATMQGISVFVREATWRTNAWKIGSTWTEQRYLRWHPSHQLPAVWLSHFQVDFQESKVQRIQLELPASLQIWFMKILSQETLPKPFYFS